MPRVPAVLLQASGPNSLGLARSLIAHDIPVVATDHNPTALTTHSRGVSSAVLRDPLSDPGGFVQDLLDLADRLGADRPVLFATHDEALAAIAVREDEVRERFRVPWSPWSDMQITINKGGQHAAAKAIGFPVPGTVDLPHDADPVAAVADAGLRYPVILKPKYAPEFRKRFGVQVIQAAGPDALAAAWVDAAAYGPQIQEVIPGEDDCFWTVGSYRDADMRRLATFVGRKLRQSPPHFGTARVAEAEWDGDLADRAHALLDALRFHGISQVEVKRDPRDGRDYLIEVNPRSWMWNSLATHVGVNLALACYLDAIGEPRTWPPGHRGGVRWVLTAKHLVLSTREIARGQWNVRDFARSVRPPLIDGALSVRDPKPALRQYAGLLRRFRR